MKKFIIKLFAIAVVVVISVGLIIKIAQNGFTDKNAKYEDCTSACWSMEIGLKGTAPDKSLEYSKCQRICIDKYK